MSSIVVELADRLWQHELATNPFHRIRLGLPITSLPLADRAEVEDDAAFARQLLADLNAVDLSAASHEDVLTAGCVRHLAGVLSRAPEFFDHSFPAMPYTSYHLAYYGQNLFRTFDMSAAGAGDVYLSLLRDFGLGIAAIEQRARDQIAKGILLPQPAIPTARANVAGLVPMVQAFLLPAADRLADSVIDADAVQAQLDSEVLPRIASLAALFEEDWCAQAPEQVGLGAQPGGLDAYEFAIEANNTISLSADHVHRTGLEQVAMLAEQMAAIRAELGFGGTEEEFHAGLRHEPELYVSTPEELLERYRGYMRRLEPRLSEFFSVLPQAPFDVMRLDPSLEAGMTYGYYEPPTPERAEGLYRYNASELASRSLLNAAAIIFHELAPGHHFHLARQAENESLPEIRRYSAAFGAFNEGWAEYASGLAGEMGGYATPLERYGRLAHERFTAQRLVVDTGMNAMGWTLEEGRAYMLANTFESELQVSTETIRYSVDLPGQALGYRLGYLTIQGLRERAEKALGERFDIRAFHEAAVGSGALPLSVLEAHIDHFIDHFVETSAS